MRKIVGFSLIYIFYVVNIFRVNIVKIKKIKILRVIKFVIKRIYIVLCYSIFLSYFNYNFKVLFIFLVWYDFFNVILINSEELFMKYSVYYLVRRFLWNRGWVIIIGFFGDGK